MKSSQLYSQKKEMRIHLRKRLSGMSLKKRDSKSGKIIKKLLKEKIFQKAETIFTYISLPDEVQTLGLIRKALQLGKRVFAPKMKLAAPRFDVCEIRHIKKDLKKGRFGVLEPVRIRKIHYRKLDLIVVPGLAFDRKGNRLGRGKGYFDRFLEKTGKIPTVSLAFKEQIVKKVPVGKHDIAVGKVISG